MINPMADPDLQIRMGVGGGGGHPDPEIRKGGLKNFFFRPLRPQFSLKISGEGGGGPLDPSPGSATVIVMQLFTSTVKGLNPGVILKIA